MRILLVEDNKRLSDSLKLALRDDHYAVDTAYNGLDGEEMALMPVYDVIILDVMLPGKDGISICKDLRNRDVKTPIIMLTARGRVERPCPGPRSGADDYLVKPFELEELRARLRALLRRDAPEKSGTLQYRDLVLIPRPMAFTAESTST